MLFDSDVLIWVLRGQKEAVDFLYSASQKDKTMSIISYMELLEGARNKRELTLLKKWIAYEKFQILPLNEEIGGIASDLIEKFVLSDNLEIDDALIAATAVFYDKTLLTGNVKHFRKLGIKIRAFEIFNAQ